MKKILSMMIILIMFAGQVVYAEAEISSRAEDTSEIEEVNESEAVFADEAVWGQVSTDIELTKGDYFNLGRGILPSYPPEVTGEIVENDQVISISSDKGTVHALNMGKMRLKIAYKGYSKTIIVTVNGIDANQPLGNGSAEKIVVGPGYRYGMETAGIMKIDRKGILYEDGGLWTMTPKVEKVGEHVKDFVLDCVITYKDSSQSGMEAKDVCYTLDDENRLWSEGKELASDIVKFDAYYALDSGGVLRCLYKAEQMEGIKDWITDGTRSVVYLLKEDGSLWKNEKFNILDDSDGFFKIAENVVEIGESNFLDRSGNLYDYRAPQSVVAMDVNKILAVVPAEKSGSFGKSFTAYQNRDGDLYLGVLPPDYYFMESSADQKPVYHNIGENGLREISTATASWNGPYSEQIFLVLTDIGDVYGYNSSNEEILLIDSNVSEVGSYGYQKADGSYYRIEQKKGVPYTVSDAEPLTVFSCDNTIVFTDITYNYSLEVTSAAGDCMVTKTDNLQDGSIREHVPLLNHVKKMWRDSEQIYALRTDGSIWNMEDIPRMVLGSSQDSTMRGDVNSDKKVDIQDLRLVLRYVCGKTELSTQQIEIADVEKNDGKVDIQDLRKILRYVCKKITTL